MAPADVGLLVLDRLGGRLADLQLPLVEPGPQHLPRPLAAPEPRALALAGHHDVGRDVGQAYGGVGLVDVLPARARGPIGVGAHVGRIDLDGDGVVHHRVGPDRREGRVAPGV